MTQMRAGATWQARIRVGGFEPFSTVDWPGALAAVVFLQGCPWRCGYCHNPHMQARSGAAPFSWAAVEAQLQRRRGWLDGVVFSGGEPTLDAALPEAVQRVRALDYRVGLHTGGAYPQRLAALLPHLDWIGFDLKTDPAGYDAVTGTPGSGAHAMESLALVADSGVACEFRLTYHSGLVEADAVLRAADRLAALGVRSFVLQEFRRDGVADELPPHDGLDAALVQALRERFETFTLRGAF